MKSYISGLLALPKLKGESASDLRKMFHCVNSAVGALDGIGRPLTRSDDLTVQLVSELLDPVSRREWETLLSQSTEPPSLDELLRFINQRMRTLESLQPSKAESTSAKASNGATRQTRALHVRKQEAQSGRCLLCSKEHYLRLCPSYLGKSGAERKQVIDSNGLCTNCLGRHKVSDCTSQKTCLACGAKHHSTTPTSQPLPRRLPM